MNEFWGGPFFNDKSKLGSPCHKERKNLHTDSIDQIFRRDLVGGKKLADTITELAGDEKETFLDFASGMLQWMPEKRKTAGELLQHPIFASLNKKRSQWRMDV